MIGERNLAAGWPCQLGRRVWGGGKKLVMITVMKIIIIGEMGTIIIVMITTIVGCGEVRKLVSVMITTITVHNSHNSLVGCGEVEKITLLL